MSEMDLPLSPSSSSSQADDATEALPKLHILIKLHAGSLLGKGFRRVIGLG
jgi:hypothetical protein